MEMQETLTLILVLAAAVFVAMTIVRTFQSQGCGSACGKCEPESNPEAANRVSLL